MERRGTRYVADALRTVPGVAVSRTGTLGGLTQIRLRGADSNQILVLIDGVEVSSVADGEFDFGSLLATDIEKIEVIRGPQSSFFGSNAAAGVISIVTKRAARGEATVRFTGETGTDGTLFGSAGLAAGGETWDIDLSAAIRNVEGHDISTVGNGEKDGDLNATVNLKANLDVTPDLRVGGTFRVTDRESDGDGFGFAGDEQGLTVNNDDTSEQTQIFVSSFLRFEALDDALVNTLRLEYTDSERSNLQNGLETFRTEGSRLHASGQSSYAFATGGAATHVVTGAVEYEREVNIAQTRDFATFPPAVIDEDEQVRETVALIGEYRLNLFRDFDLQVGARQDFNDAFEDAFTYSVAASYKLAATGTRFHGSVGRGVTNPTFIEQFGFFPSSFIGNELLEPERTFSWDIGAEQTLLNGRLVADLTYFRARVEDEIVGGFNVDAGLPTSVNAPGQSEREGLELALSALPIEGVSVGATYTYTLSQDSADVFEVRVPRHAASMDATYAFLGGRASVTAGVSYQGDRRDLDFTTGAFPAPQTVLDDYVLLSFAGQYRVNENVELFARVENATNSDYEEVFTFSTPGIEAFAGVRIRY